MAAQERPYWSPWSRRLTSAVNIGIVGFLSRSFLYTLNKTEVHGLNRFLDILDGRKDEKSRTRGLITVSNHVSVLDDPMIWGVLPNRYFWNPENMRWSLGSYDICFKSRIHNAFFSYGNTLPTHRAAYSKFGGLFQPAITHAIQLLSDPHAHTAPENWEGRSFRAEESLDSFPRSDPFSTPEFYTTTGTDIFPAPAVYPSRRHSWIHIFPEGMIHQHPDKVMRYFKWGVARLILEAEPCPDVLPMWIDGPQHVMAEDRPWPRPMPRIGREIRVNFGDLVDTERVFGPFRSKWQELKARSRQKRLLLADKDASSQRNDELGVLTDDDLKYSPEAEQLRIDVTMAIRNEVLRLRKSTGLPDEDPKRGLADTWRLEGKMSAREGLKEDGSVVKGP